MLKKLNEWMCPIISWKQSEWCVCTSKENFVLVLGSIEFRLYVGVWLSSLLDIVKNQSYIVLYYTSYLKSFYMKVLSYCWRVEFWGIGQMSYILYLYLNLILLIRKSFCKTLVYLFDTCYEFCKSLLIFKWQFP